MSFEIKSWRDGRVLFTAKGASDVREALEEARREGANLREANLEGANLRGAYLEGAYLEGAYLEEANLGGANLRRARWNGLVLSGLPSGDLMLLPGKEDGWLLRIGCWSGTVDELETMIAGDDWPEANADQRLERRPGLEATVALCRAHIARVEAGSRSEGPVQ